MTIIRSTDASMRHRSPTNSRPHENIQLRRDYVAENWFCELSDLLDESGDRDWRRRMAQAVNMNMDPNHIYSAGMRPDYSWNLITVCRPAHDWFHAHLTDGRILCYRVKCIKGDINEPEFFRVFGRHLRGLIDNMRGSTPFFERLRNEVLEHLSSIEHTERKLLEGN